MSGDLSYRLRSLRDKRQWTVADMAERTGIPKRTLDKYMLRNNPILPGYEALLSLSKGLGVSLDWLVFGAETVSEVSKLIAEMAATKVSQQHFETILRELQKVGAIEPSEEILVGLSPEMWACDLGSRVGEAVQEIAAGGITLEELLHWSDRNTERQGELVQDMANRFLYPVKSGA
ncbi:helix-turn-helix transcriptional regulator [Sulfitobacter sp. F26204]|uniref:helix-turn-helix domain-containing protein n=1 Tax=Sulfitobacter sp. F26204 TaxID=2996014 RepID=UPI00225E2C0B|nr:helix-turn-helix transcriptional regulator [Sulfitobacter sp. F26204]MCX7559116.1 helix-turn-helix transcriptional regulator [Sulfitobacter sp. F26204]